MRTFSISFKIVKIFSENAYILKKDCAMILLVTGERLNKGVELYTHKSLIVQVTSQHLQNIIT